MLARRHLRWIAPTLVLGVAAALRLWALDRPGTLVFDELYYVRDAISQLAHGFPTSWPTDDPDLAGSGATAYTGDASYAVHPPLGKWLIGLGILVFGPDTGWGWRSSSALLGVATVALVMRLGWHLTRSAPTAWIAGFLLAVDGVHVTLSRVGLLDGLLTFFIVLGALFAWRDLEASSLAVPDADGRIKVAWLRPWLVASAATFGLAASVKWSGLYPLAAFLILITLRDLSARLRASRTGPAVRGAAGQATVAAILALPTALAAYLVTWAGWITTAGGWMRGSEEAWPAALARYHVEMLNWHGSLSAPHPYQSAPMSWPLGIRPTAMYEHRWTSGCPWSECVAAVSPIPNPIVTWAGALAVVALAWLAARAATTRRTDLAPRAAVFVVVGFLSGWLPWVLTFSRPAVFQFYAVVLTPFTALALALVLGRLCRIRPVDTALPRLTPDALLGRRIATSLLLGFALAVALWFFPLWSGTPIADWFYRAHIWLPGWD